MMKRHEALEATMQSSFLLQVMRIGTSMIVAMVGCLSLEWAPFFAVSFVGSLPESVASTIAEDDRNPKFGFIGLHGGVFEQIESQQQALGIETKYFDDASIADRTATLSSVDLLIIQHTREEDRDAYVECIRKARETNPDLVILVLQSNSLDWMKAIHLGGHVHHDPKASQYYGSSRENLRRMLVYLLVQYLGKNLEVQPPVAVEREGLYHPEHPDLFRSAEEFLVWARERKRFRAAQPRIAIAVHSTHLFFQQPKVVDALIAEAEKQGAIAVAFLDGRSKLYESEIQAFAPSAVIHTCHSTDAMDLRTTLDVPHLHSIFLRKQTIEEWQESMDGLSSGELAFHVIGQELIGGIEPQVAAGLSKSQQESDAFTPIPERVEHLVRRALAHAKLRAIDNAEKKIAILYYDREMGKGELMRGSATGMHMNGPRSLLHVLDRMRRAGYPMAPMPRHEDQLLGWMMERGRLIGVWAPRELDHLVRFGDPALVPASQYVEWFHTKVPFDRQQQIRERWGEPPGKFMVWNDGKTEYLVIPRISLGNTILLPQPLRGELHGKETASSQAHDAVSAPPHNYLATYFWLQEEFQANALVHFGTHGSEFALPGKPNGLSRRDWPDIIMGSIPNFNPWIVENMVESSPVRRRAYGTLISHLPPPIVHVGLSDELANLEETLQKWESLEDGALKERFRAEIEKRVVATRLDRDLHMNPEQGTALSLSDEQIRRVTSYLTSLKEEAIPTTLHVFGTPPGKDLLPAYLATILRPPFQRAVGAVLASDSEDSARESVHRILRRMVEDHVDGKQSIEMELGRTLESMPEVLEKGLTLVDTLLKGFARTTDEVDNLLRGLDGKFIPPGPGNSPIRNPSVVPTGRNMVLLNPEEIPTQPSWEIGKKLAEELIQRHLDQHGAYPTKLGFDLRSSATFRDYGVMESQILALIGVEPVWDERMLVHELKLIPRKELGRPRVDVFIAAGSWYDSNLPTRLMLWDKAIRMAAESQEDDNRIAMHSKQIADRVAARGVGQSDIERLQHARIFGRALGREAGNQLAVSVARSGDWNDRRELADEVIATMDHVYTRDAWGDKASTFYEAAIQGTHTVVRSWSDQMTGPLSSKYTWSHGGSLSLAVEFMTGNRPEYLFNDVRDPDKVGILASEDAIRREFRTRLANPAWLRGMQKEGYAGADHIRVMVANSFGWDSMRPGSIGNDQWMEMKRIVVDDKLNLNLREWFEIQNPYAYQDANATLLEAIRKGFWEADEETKMQLVREYAESVIRHGPSGNITGGGNKALEMLILQTLSSAATPEASGTADRFQTAMDAIRVEPVSASLTQTILEGQAQPAIESVTTSPAPPQPIDDVQSSSPPSETPRADVATTEATAPIDVITGNRLEPIALRDDRSSPASWWGVAVACVAVFVAGLLWNRGY